MVFIVEIKNLRTKQGTSIIRQAISENFKQLRNFCLQKKIDHMYGISTNFGLWVFTKYSRSDEIFHDKNPFCLTESVEILDLCSYKIKEEELQKLVLLLDMLAADIVEVSLKTNTKNR